MREADSHLLQAFGIRQGGFAVVPGDLQGVGTGTAPFFSGLNPPQACPASATPTEAIQQTTLERQPVTPAHKAAAL